MSVPRRDKDSRRSVDNYLPKMGDALGFSIVDNAVGKVLGTNKKSSGFTDNVKVVKPGESK